MIVFFKINNLKSILTAEETNNSSVHTVVGVYDNVKTKLQYL
jgi:hypothetical protein